MSISSICRVIMLLLNHACDVCVAFAGAGIFFLEMVLKISACGIRGYLSNTFNRFDCVVVCISLVELALSPPGFLGLPQILSASSLFV